MINVHDPKNFGFNIVSLIIFYLDNKQSTLDNVVSLLFLSVILFSEVELYFQLFLFLDIVYDPDAVLTALHAAFLFFLNSAI